MKKFMTVMLVLSSFQVFAVSGSRVSCVLNGELVPVGPTTYLKDGPPQQSCVCTANGTQDAIWNCTDVATAQNVISGAPVNGKIIKRK